MNGAIDKIKSFWARITRVFHKKKYREIFKWIIIILLGTAIFTTISLSRRAGLNTVNNIVYAVLISAIGLYTLVYGKFAINFFGITLFAFSLALLVSALVNRNYMWRNFTMFLLSATAFVVYQFLISEKKNLNHFILAFIIGGGASMLYFFIIYAKPLLNFDFSIRLGDYFDNQNGIGRIFSLLAIFYLYLAVFRKWKLMYIPFIIGAWFILSTGSMGALFILILFVLIIVYLKVPKGKKFLFWIILGATILFLFLILQIPPLGYFKRRIYGMLSAFIGVETGNFDESSASRAQLALESFMLFLRKPLFGFGPDQTTKFTSFSTYAHNNFAELLGNYGLAGLILFELLLFVPLFKNHQKKPKDYLLVTLSLLHVILYQFLSHPFSDKLTYFLLAYFFANYYVDKRKFSNLLVENKLIFYTISLE